QIGVELFGHAGMESDAEVISLLLDTLALAEVPQVTLDLGHVGIYRALVKAGGLSERDEAALSDIYLRKARHELDQMLAELSLTAEQRDALASLPWLAGDIDVLARAREMLAAFNSAVVAACDELEARAYDRRAACRHGRLCLALGQLRGDHSQPGCVFGAYRGDRCERFAKGGRYARTGEGS